MPPYSEKNNPAAIPSETISSETPGCRFRYFSPWLVVLTLVWLAVYGQVFEDPYGLASRNWPLVLLGVIGAVVGNLTAIGGGVVFIPALMFVYKIDPVSALKLAFVTQAVGMSSGASGWLRRGQVPLNLLPWTIPPLVLGSAVSTFLFHPNGMLVKSLFGPISVLAGLLVLYPVTTRSQVADVPTRIRAPLILVAFLGGLITGWVAIGEGEFVAAFCILAGGLRSERAVGLGVLLLAFNSVLLALVHTLYFGGIPWEMAMFTMLGVLWGGRLGPYIAQWLSAGALKRFFAVIAVIDGALMTLQSLRALLH